MTRSLRPWLLVAPLSALGVLAAHRLAYLLTGVPEKEVHGYLTHAPQLALLLVVLSLLGAACAERGSRVVSWPFPAVAISGFVLQEHLERLAQTGSWPFLLDKPFFLVGLALQALVAVVAWLLGRLLVRVLGRRPCVVVVFADALGVRRAPGGLLSRRGARWAGARAPPPRTLTA